MSAQGFPSLGTSLFSGLEVLESFQKAFTDGEAGVAPTIDHLRVFMFIALATTLGEKIELRSLSGPSSPFGPSMSQTKMHRICASFKQIELLDTRKGDFDPRLHTIHLTTKGYAFAEKLSKHFQDVPDVTKPRKLRMDELIGEAQGLRFHNEAVQGHMAALNEKVASMDWQAELKQALARKGIPNAEVGKNYVKTNRADGTTRGSVSMSVLFKRTNTRNLAMLTVEIDDMQDDELDQLLTPNIKHRDVSTDAYAELTAMIDKYGQTAIDENPALSRQRALLAAQIAREATAKASK